MSSHLFSHPADPSSARGRLFWVVLGSVAVAQLLAFWLLCSHQVRKAEVRRASAEVQQLALSDCLEYIPGSTIASCSRTPVAQLAADGAQPLRPAHAGALGGAMPVSFTR